MEQVLDVRWDSEWAAGHVPGSLHIPIDELDDRLAEIDPERPVVVLCRTGSRSASAGQQLRAEGFDASSYEGGLLAWVEAGRPFDGEVAEAEADARPEGLQRLESEFLSVLMAVQERFGDTEPSDEEVRAFLRDRLVSQGRTPAEADRFLEEMDG